ncbi:MAG: hypothetical protein NTV24_05015 [Candidatus Woesebacteria bacterium]|nr:hypothetical protein [Candidatus Woesebacteria bacterium]
MDQVEFDKIKNKIGICKDFFLSFKRLPTPLQAIAIRRVIELTDEIASKPESALKYVGDLASKRKYFPNSAEILETGEMFPFRSIRLPKDEENNDIVAINFVSCFLVNKLGLTQAVEHFCKPPGGFTDDKICLISCSYFSFDSLE